MRFSIVAAFCVLLAGCQHQPADSFAGYGCINRLRMIEGSKQQWMLENHKTTNDVPTWDDIRPYLNREGKIPSCPWGGTYTLGRMDEQPRCSIGGPSHTLPPWILTQ